MDGIDRLAGQLSPNAIKAHVEKLVAWAESATGEAKDYHAATARRWTAWVASGPPYYLNDRLPDDPEASHGGNGQY